MKRIRPITRSEVQDILDNNRRIAELVRERIGPTTWKELREECGVTQSSLDNALEKGGALSPLNRGHARRSSMSGYDVLKKLTLEMFPRSSAQYASCIRRAANEIDAESTDL